MGNVRRNALEMRGSWPDPQERKASKARLAAHIAARPEAVLICNTRSRRGADSFVRAGELLAQHGFHVTHAHAVTSEDELAQRVEDAASAGSSLIVVGGGDGTLSSIVGSFAYREAVLGLLPLGTGNSFARTLDIPLRLDEAVDVIANGKIADVDLGVVNGEYFANVVTIGLSAEAAHRTPHFLKRLVGPAAYVLTGAGKTLTHAAFACSITTADAESAEAPTKIDVRTHQIIVASGRFFGTSPLRPEAHVDDRRIDVFTLAGVNRWRLAQMWASILLRPGKLADTGDFISTASVLIETEPRKEIDVDGEIRGRTPAEFYVAPEALKVMTPGAFVELN